jgi:hypothetical protein
MGLNEFAGYFAVGVALGIIAEKYGVTLILLSWNWNFDSRIFCLRYFLSKTLVILYIKKLFLVQ